MSGGQLRLFDEVPQPKPRASVELHEDAHSYAVLYTATATGKHSGPRFLMTIDDARVWCSSPLSRGKHYADEWAYFFTSLHNFVASPWSRGWSHGIDLSEMQDNGTWDDRITSTGARKIPIQEVLEILHRLQIPVRTTA